MREEAGVGWGGKVSDVSAKGKELRKQSISAGAWRVCAWLQ